MTVLRSDSCMRNRHHECSGAVEECLHKQGCKCPCHNTVLYGPHEDTDPKELNFSDEYKAAA